MKIKSLFRSISNNPPIPTLTLDVGSTGVISVTSTSIDSLTEKYGEYTSRNYYYGSSAFIPYVMGPPQSPLKIRQEPKVYEVDATPKQRKFYLDE